MTYQSGVATQHHADILQISAVFEDKIYDQYITPTRSMAPGSSAVTGLTAEGGVLFHNGTHVPTLPLLQVLQNFLARLNDTGNVMLIGQNFDFPRLICAFKKCYLDSAFNVCVTGISDTLLIFRDLYSLTDVQSLQTLCPSKTEDGSIFYKHSVTTSSVLSKIEFESKGAQNVDSF